MGWGIIKGFNKGIEFDLFFLKNAGFASACIFLL